MIDLKKESLEKINLRKESLEKIILTKKLDNVVARIYLCLDCSGSMENLYKNNEIQTLIERILPLAMKFDDDGMLEIMLFSNDAFNLTPVSVDNFYNFVNDKVLNFCTWSGTYYAPFINLVLKEFISENIQEQPKSLFQKIKNYFKKKEVEIKEDLGSKTPIYFLCITDGENSDDFETQVSLRNSENLHIYFQFVGIGTSSFNSLEKYSTQFKNVSFFSVKDIKNLTDDQLYNKLLDNFSNLKNN